MDENTDNWKTKVNNIEKNGTPLRSVFTTGRHFIENTYNSTLGSVSNGGFVSNFYGEGANSVTKSLESFKKNNKEFTDFCYLYPSTVVGVTTAVVAIPTYKVFRFRAAFFASGFTAIVTAGILKLLSTDVSSKKKD